MARLVKARWLKRIMRRAPYLEYVPWGLEALGIRLLWLISSLMTPERASQMGRKIISAIGPRSYKAQHVLDNLSVVFPDKTASEISELAREVWSNFGAVLAEFPHAKTLLREQEPYIEIILDEQSRNIIESGGPAIFLVPHLGNWELVAGVIVKSGAPLSAIFSPQSNPFLDRMLQRQRQALGCRFLAKQSALRSMFRELNNGRSIGLLPDQRVDSGRLVPFCSVDALTTTSPARVALRYGCALIPVRMERLYGCHFRTTFYAPIRTDDYTGDEAEKAFQITAKINDLTASWIRERPEQWLCVKRRWPKSIPTKEQVGP